MTKNSVMCAIDVNDFDQNVVDLAATFARAFGVDLEIVHVTLLPGFDTESGYYGPIQPLANIYADSELLKKIRPTDPDIRVQHSQMLGMPNQRLIDAINVYQPQLVVAGTHGRRGLKRILLGSVAEHLLRNANCPVLLLSESASTSHSEEIELEKKRTQSLHSAS